MTSFDVHVDLYIDGVWTDVSTDVRAAGGVQIIRGATDEQSRVATGRCTLELSDPSGKYNRSNPSSTLYGKLTPNLPIRVRVGSTDVRGVFEVPQWPPRGDVSGRNVWIALEASGILRRLQQGAKAVRSPLAVYTPTTSPVAWWPLDDGRTQTTLRSEVAGVPAMTCPPLTTVTNGGDRAATNVAEVAKLAEVAGPTGFPGRVLDMMTPRGGGWSIPPVWDVSVPTSLTSGQWVIDCWLYIDPGNADNSGYNTTYLRWFTSDGTRPRWRIYSTTSSSVPIIGVECADSTGFTVTQFTTAVTLNWADRTWHYLRVVATTSGSDTAVTFYMDGASVASGTVTGVGPGSVNRMTIPGHSEIAANFLDQVALANLTIYTSHDATQMATILDAGNGYTGETAGRRMERLCGENSVTFAGDGDLDDTAAMGPQSVGTLVDLLQGCADADQGVLFETRTALGLTYRTRTSLYSQASALDLGYTASQVDGSLMPADDDRLTWNDVTVQRPDGIPVRVTLDVNTLNHGRSTAAPPDGVGTYDRGPVTLNVETDEQAKHTAEWLVHLGTWDERRFPSLTVHLAHPTWVADPARAAQAGALDIGDLATLANLPVFYRNVDSLTALLVQGCTEYLAPRERWLRWNFTPGWPWEVWNLDTGGSTLAVAVNSAATSLKLATSSGPPWSTSRTPYHLVIDGEAVTASAMATATPAFIAAGTVAHANNASVTPGLPAGMTADSGQVILCWAAIRSSGTGTVDLPAGWTSLVNFGNCRLFGKYYVTGDTAPTVTFTGGAAGDDTSARLFGFSGTSLELDASATQLNGSAQNIAYPALDVKRTNNVMLVFGWKQDDWTSVATLAGFTEMADDFTVTGNDQGIVADYRLDTTPADLAAGSFTVTGGTSQISRAVVVALRPLQTATVTRSVNGVSKSLAAAKAVHGWRLGVTAL